MSAKRLDDLRIVDPVLTTIAQNWKNDLYLSEQLFPTITVSKSKGKIPIFGKEAFYLRETDRAIRGDSNRVSTTEYKLETYETQERDIEMAIDYLECSEAMNYEKYEQKITKELRDVLALNREREIAEHIQNPDNYGSHQRTVLSDADAFNSPTSSIDHIELIKQSKEAMRANIGRVPNTMMLNNATLEAIMKSSFFLEVCNQSNIIKPSLSMLKEYIGIDNFMINNGVYTEDGLTFKDIWKDNILLMYLDHNTAKQHSEYNPSFGYIFQLEGNPEVDTYYENGGKVKVIRCTDNFCWKITAPDAAYLIANTIA